MSLLQVQARALGDPTRHDIFRYVADAGRPVFVAELTEHFGFNHNAIRQHLAKLTGAGLVDEQQAPPSGRGRPRLQYTVAPAAESRWGVTGPYERLATLLTEILRSGDSPVEVGRRTGRRPLTSEEAAGAPIGPVVDEMARQGFDPVVRRRGNHLDITLQTCPFVSAVLTDPATVCDLHLGLAQGFAEAVDGITIDELVPKDPRRAHCRLRCTLTPTT